MKINLIYFTEAGRDTCRKIEEGLTEEGHCCAASDGRGLSGGLARWTEEAFASGGALVFVCAAGIAVRAIAPHIRSKTTDPAVVVADEMGLHAISLLSGHMGGANGLTRRIAEVTGARPVITTATDINGRFAVDQWAKEQKLVIADMEAAKAVSAALLRGEGVSFYSEFPVEGRLPEGLERWMGETKSESETETGAVADGAETETGAETGAETEPGNGICIAISLRRPGNLPFQKVLWLIPQALILGIGCRRGTTAEQIQAAALRAAADGGIWLPSVKKIVSIDLKKDETGLIDFAARLGVPFEVYSAAELAAVNLPEGFTGSSFVRSVTGVDNVCERAAVLGVLREGTELPELLLRKRAEDGVTVAAAACGEIRIKI